VIYIDDESLIGGKSPAKAGLSLQEEPSNVTLTIDVSRIALQTALAM